MARKTTVVTLDETDFTIPALNLDQLERAGIAVTELGAQRAPFAILRIAMERAEPKMVDPEDFAPSPDQIGAAITKIMVLSGLQQPDQNPPGTAGAPPAV